MLESDPASASLAWRHYRRMMRWVTLSAVLLVAGALGWFATQGPIPVAMLIATIAGIGGSVLLGGALMLLLFLSAGTGHDDNAGGHDDRT